MLKETLTYTDYNGNKRTEDFYFNLNKGELIDLETSVEGGFIEWVETLIQKQDGPTIMRVFRDVLRKAYGEKSTDGKYLNKSEEIFNRFMHTEAYSDLYYKLCTDAEYAAKFMNSIIPDKSHIKDAAPNTDK